MAQGNSHWHWQQSYSLDRFEQVERLKKKYLFCSWHSQQRNFLLHKLNSSCGNYWSGKLLKEGNYSRKYGISYVYDCLRGPLVANWNLEDLFKRPKANITGILDLQESSKIEIKIYLLKYLRLVENLFERAFGSENFDFGSW